LALLAQLRRNPLECWAKQHFEKLIVEGGLPFGRVVLVNEPAAIKRVLLDNAEAYAKDRLQRRVLSAGLGDGLLSAEGQCWRSQRRALSPLFALRAVRDFEPAMAAAADEIMRRWPADGEVDLAVEMRRITLHVLERTIFTDGLGRDAEDIRRAMALYFDDIGKIGALDLLGAPGWLRPGKRGVGEALKVFEAAIDQVVGERRSRLARAPESAPADILTRLLTAEDERGPMSDAEVRSNILTFFAAGHETTANALTWAAFLLSQSPAWLERVRADPETASRAVIDEALRLYPPIAAISRVALEGDRLAGVAIRKGTLVVISPYVLHRHRRLWDHPGRFDPGRFLGAARERIDRFAYLPFGAGPRTCIGAAFAQQEAALVMSALVGRFDFALAKGQSVWPLLRVTLRPAEGLRMRLRRRPSPLRAPMERTLAA
jgi:cytochrome P450